ncbi:osteopontin isoform X2 [Gouania willdenowi]|uniref:Dentin sialophosphoprotein-like n=1 Tax=Gouania willdenowi TaxID=441366 RepID=A0A8C5H0G2_GOUWI|nr:dentin sialophosphoprotein-like isoform X2 [Gouania willdenowi]
MKAVVVFVLLFATVLCRPARKFSLSSSESSEEAARRPAPPVQRKQAQVVPQARAAPVQAAAPSEESSEEEELAKEVKSDSVDTTSASDTTSVNSDSDEDDDSDETEESDPQEEDEDDDSSDSADSESGELSTASPTDTPALVTEEPVTEDPFEPTIVTDTDSGRGDSFAGYPSDYKSIIYVEDKSYHKSPDYYKSYEFVDSGKKSAYGMTDGNDVEKSLKVYKAFHVHSDFLEEDTSTPEVESQGLDPLSGPAGDQNLNPRQAYLPEEEESVSPTEATTSDSSSGQTEEEEEEESASTSQESQDEDSESSEEATATPGAADSDSDESEDSEGDSEEAAVDTVTDAPVVVTAK